MFHYYQKVGGEEQWKPVPAAQLPTIIERDQPMLVTVLAVNKLVEEVKSEDHDKLAYEGPFYIDWDDENDVGRVLEKVREFIAKLEALKLDPTMARWFVTGSKGVHCEIPTECFMEKPVKGGVQLLPAVYREMVMEHYVDTIDMRVYSARRGRMWRQPNVLRENGKYKVQVTVDELRSMDRESYLSLCSQPRELFAPTPPELCIDLSVTYSRALQKVSDVIKARKNRKRDPKAKERAKSDSIVFMMNGLGIKPGVGFHQLALQLGIIANTAGMTEDELVAECEQLIASHQSDGKRYNTPDKRREELRRMHRYTSDNPMYDFSIGAIKTLLTHAAPDLDGIVVEKEDLKQEIEESQSEAVAKDENDKTPDEYADIAGGVALSKYGVYVATEEGGKRRICAVSFEDIHLLVSTDTGQIVAYEAQVLVNGRRSGRQTIEMETFQSVLMFNRFCQRLGHQMQGAESHLRGLFMRFIELAKKKGRTLYIAKREGLDIFNIPNHDDPELREPFLVWADGKGVILEPRVRSKEGLDISFQGFPDARGLYKTDIADAPKLKEWCQTAANREALMETLRSMFGCQRPDVISKMIGWYTACFYRALFHRAYGKFPLLHVNGAAGAGKTEMNKVMAHLFFYNQEPKTLTPQSTPFAIQQHMASSVSVPLILDEYKPHEMSIELHNRLKLLFRDAYNMREVMKGGGNRDSDDYRSLTQTQLAAPMVFIAEAAEEEAAVAERVVLLTVVKPASSVSLKWLARFQHWERNKKHMAILGQYLASEAINTTSIKSLQEEFDVIFEEARNRFMLTEADLTAGLDDATLAEKQGAKERSVYNFTVARFGLLRFKRLVEAIFGPGEFAETFADLEGAIYTRMTDLQPATQAEWAKVLDAFSTMSYSLDGDSPHALRREQEYAMGVENGRNIIELSMMACYLKYRAYYRSTGSKPLFSGPQSFLHSIKDSPAFLRQGRGELLDKPGVYVFDVDELAKLRVGEFK